MNLFTHHRRSAVAIMAALTLSACGGGGGSDSPKTSATTTFPLASAMTALLKEAKSTPFTVTGTASGNGRVLTVTGSGASLESNAVGNFNGAAAVVKTIRTTGTFIANGTAIPVGDFISTQYFDSNYKPLGVLSQFGYCVNSAQIALPATVRIGDAGDHYTSTCYTNSARTTLVGTTKVSYALEPATETTAIFKLIFKPINAGASAAPLTQNYVISTNGTLVLADSPNILTVSGVTLDLVFKYQ